MKIHDIDESPVGDLKRFIHRQAFPGHYDKAANYLYKVLKRKQEENGGNWRHAFGYYAQQIGRSFKGIDTRNLMKIFAQRYGEEFPKLVKEFKIVKPDPEDTLGIKRNEMPQVATKDYPEFMDYLKDSGAKFKKETVPAKTLKAIQGEFSDQGVEKALRKRKLKKASIVSSDNYIIDGHHRWVAALNTGQDVDIIRVNMPAKKLLQLVKDFSKTTYKDIYTEKSSQALGIPKNATLAQLDKIASTATGAKRERAHYLRNMRRGRQKAEGLEEGAPIIIAGLVAKALAKKGIKVGKDIIKGYLRNAPPGASPDQIANTILKTGAAAQAGYAGYKKKKELSEGYKLQLERGDDMDVLHIYDTKLKQRTEVRGKPNYEIKHDKNDKLHQLIDKIGKAVNISELMNGEVVSINPNHPQGELAKKLTTKAFNEEVLPAKNVMSSELLELDKAFKKKGYELRIVGGAVRDLALGKDPKDIDLATDATPDEMEKVFDSAGIKSVPTGVEHGTLTAVINDKPFEITTLRSDQETDGRFAKVEFVKSWEEDAKRRDLTYNAMSMDFEGNLYDYHGGMDDLQDKVSKFVGDPAERIQEDYLRALRYFRFQGRLDNPKFDEDTLKAITANKDGLKKLSVERVWSEVGKILGGNNIKEVLTAMNNTGVSQAIGLQAEIHKDLMDGGDPIINLARITNDKSIGAKWKMSNEEKAKLDFLISNKGKKFNKDFYTDSIIAGTDRKLLDALARYNNQDDMIQYVANFEAPEFPVTGNDLIAKGMKSGPELGKALDALKDKWKQSGYKMNKDQLLGENIPMPVTKRDAALAKQAKHLKMKSMLRPRTVDTMVAPNKGYLDTMKQTGQDADKLSKAAGIDPNYTRNAVANTMKNAQPNAKLRAKFGRNKTENAPGSIAAKINWGGKNKDTKVKKAQSWFARAKKAVFGEAEEKPHLYLDMDGVQADFFGAWAKWYSNKTGKQITSYRDIGDAEAQLASIMELTNQGPEFVEKFFANLEPLQGFATVMNWIQKNDIPYSVLSAPLRGNNAASIAGKKSWLARHNPGAQQEIFTGRKESYAINKQTKQPNVLIDDHGKYIDRWTARGGIAIKHTNRNPQATIQALEKIYNNLEEHGFVPMYSTMKAYGMKRKTTNGQKHFVTDDVNERSLTKGEEKKKEKYVKGMKKRKKEFKDRYGDEAEAVMYATATKMAKGK